MLLVAETFRSLQGEGILAGTPSFFIRTAGCNLRCAFCDTPYASWRPEGRRRTVPELVAEAAASGISHVVITGGEPLIQRDIVPLTRALADTGLHVTVETAGTAAPPIACDLLSLSPKTANSDPEGPWRERHLRRRTDLAPARALLARHAQHQLKFVVRGPEDMPEVLALLAALPEARRERVLLMPEARTRAELIARAPAVARLCLEHGFRYSPRLHLALWDAARGR